jgi:Arc/MetJ-type ribon-helix-helix transcriptional regulator
MASDPLLIEAQLVDGQSDRICVRLRENQLAYIDALIEKGVFETRSQAVRYSIIKKFDSKAGEHP